MSAIEIEYAGKDMVIPKEMAEKTLGLHPGDRVEIRPKLSLIPLERSREETSEIIRTLENFRNAFDPSDLDSWETYQKEIWASWKDRT